MFLFWYLFSTWYTLKNFNKICPPLLSRGSFFFHMTSFTWGYCSSFLCFCWAYLGNWGWKLKPSQPIQNAFQHETEIYFSSWREVRTEDKIPLSSIPKVHRWRYDKKFAHMNVQLYSLFTDASLHIWIWFEFELIFQCCQDFSFLGKHNGIPHYWNYWKKGAKKNESAIVSSFFFFSLTEIWNLNFFFKE